MATSEDVQSKTPLPLCLRLNHDVIEPLRGFSDQSCHQTYPVGQPWDLSQTRRELSLLTLTLTAPQLEPTMKTSTVLLALLGLTIAPCADAKKEFVARLPNGANVQGYEAIGHSDGTGKSDKLNSFGKAFESAGNKWTLALCKADTDGDGQTNGQELGDPCCEWSEGKTPRYTEGVSHPSDSSKKADSSLWSSINCSSVTTLSDSSAISSRGITTAAIVAGVAAIGIIAGQL